MKTIDLTRGELMIQTLKNGLKIKDTPHAITVTLWRYAQGNTELEFRVTVFTTLGDCKIGSGSSITAAINDCKTQLISAPIKIEESETISVEV